MDPAAGSRLPLGEAEFEDLLREILGRVQGALDERARWELLLEAVVSMGGDLSLDGLLDRIVAIASKLAGARYAALGVLDPGSERRLRTFIYHGIEPDEAARIGNLPEGHGLLGLIIDRPEPLRLHDIGEHEASYGFPPEHPPMHSFLGVPVRTREKVFGNLYLTEKENGTDFTEQDERIVVALAAAAGVAIENAELYQALFRRERWVQATNEISAVLLTESQEQTSLQLVADKAREVAEADACWIVSGDSPDNMHLQALSGPNVDVESLRTLPVSGSFSAEVLSSGRPLVVERYSEDARAVMARSIPNWPVLGPAVLVPLRGAQGPAGVLALGWSPEHAHHQERLDPELPASFAEQAALALQLARSHRDRERLALFEDRDRIARDLHDVVIQRLFAVGLSLQGTGRLASPELSDRLESAVDDLDTTIRDIRRTIFELGAAPQQADIQVEVTRVVQRAASTLKCRPTLTFDGPVRSRIGADAAPDVLAVLSEALSNTARHANASRVDVHLSAGEEIVLEVADDGPGIPIDAVQSGLKNMRSRAERRGGRLEVGSGPDGGTQLRWSIPAS